MTELSWMHHLETVRGRHYSDLVATIRQMKRDGEPDAALELLAECQDATIRTRQGGCPAPWYFEQAAILYRKMQRYEDEVACLGRYLSECPVGRRDQHYDTLKVRLAKAKVLCDRRTETEERSQND